MTNVIEIRTEDESEARTTLDALCLEGARRMLHQALQAEVENRAFRLRSGGASGYGRYVKLRGAPQRGDFKLRPSPGGGLIVGPMGASALRGCERLGRGRAWAMGIVG